MNITFYISDHGFGHVTRSSALISEFIRLGHYITAVTGHIQTVFLREYFAEDLKNRLRIIESPLECGIPLKKGSINVDREVFKTDYPAWLQNSKSFIDKEISRLKTNKPDLIVSDIWAGAFPIAKNLNIRSIGLCSFTFLESYEVFYPKGNYSEQLSWHQDADIYVLPAASKNDTRFMSGKKLIQCGFYSREIDYSRVTHYQSQWNSLSVVFLTIGMLDSSVNFHDEALERYFWVCSKGIHLSGNFPKWEVHQNLMDSQNLIASLNVVISKAGWGTVSESLIAGKPMIILSRPYIPEDHRMCEYVLQHNKGIVADIEKPFSLASLLEELSDKKLNLEPELNDAKKVVREMLDLIN